MMAQVWLDRQRRYFITATNDTKLAATVVRSRFLETSDAARRVELPISHTIIVKDYFNKFAAISSRIALDKISLVASWTHVTSTLNYAFPYQFQFSIIRHTCNRLFQTFELLAVAPTAI